MARTKKACIIFFDEVDAIGGARFDDGSGGDHEVQRTMLEIVNQMDGFDSRGNVRVLMATNRPDTLDPAMMRYEKVDNVGLGELIGRLSSVCQISKDVPLSSKSTRGICPWRRTSGLSCWRGCVPTPPEPI
jgi:ATP-dependent Zn protease